MQFAETGPCEVQPGSRNTAANPHWAQSNEVLVALWAFIGLNCPSPGRYAQRLPSVSWHFAGTNPKLETLMFKRQEALAADTCACPAALACMAPYTVPWLFLVDGGRRRRLAVNDRNLDLTFSLNSHLFPSPQYPMGLPRC